MFLRTTEYLHDDYYPSWIDEHPRLKARPPKPTARPVVHQLESTGAVGWFMREYPYAAMITDLRVRRQKYYCELYVSALDITIYFYSGRALTIISDYDNLLQAFDMDAYTYVFDVMLPSVVYELLPQPIAEEIVPELRTRHQRVYEKLLSRVDARVTIDIDNFYSVDRVVEFGENMEFDENIEFEYDDSEDTICKVDDKEDDYEPSYSTLDYHPAKHPCGQTVYTIDTKQYVKTHERWPNLNGLIYIKWHTLPRHQIFARGGYDIGICNCNNCRADNTREDLAAQYDDYPAVIKSPEYYLAKRWPMSHVDGDW